MSRSDERDTIFARMVYKPDDTSYQDYYTRHPELKELDDTLRKTPMYAKDVPTYNPLFAPLPAATFRIYSDLHPLSEQLPRCAPTNLGAEKMTRMLEGVAKYYGATACACIKLEDEHFYSHRGRYPDIYGKEPEKYPYAIVFVVEMEKDYVNRTPNVHSSIATTKGYLDGAVIGLMLSYYLANMGYKAYNNMSGHYLAPVVKIAEDAGLGQIGANRLLITKSCGARARIGVVMTDCELLPTGAPTNFGLEKLCAKCGLCKQQCIGKALKDDGFIQENCYKTWLTIGNDCSVCQSACPVSQTALPDDFVFTDETADAFLAAHKEKYGKRNYVADPPEWLK